MTDIKKVAEEIATRVSNAFTSTYTCPESGEESFYISGHPEDLIILITEEFHRALITHGNKVAEECARVAETCKMPDYDWSDWNGHDAMCESKKLIAQAIRERLKVECE
jgi:hypothetical protein